MAGVNIDNVGLTLTRYLEGVTETLNHSSKMRSRVQTDGPWTGSHIEWRVHVARSSAVGYFEDGAQFPVADKQDYATAKAYRKFIGGSIQLTDGSMATASGNRNVARDVIDSEVQGLTNNLLKLENGMFYKNGDGSVATVQTGSATTSLLVDDARMLWDGGTYDVYDSTLTTNRGTVTVSKVASAPTAAGYATVTLSANMPSATVATDLIVWSGSLNRAITGLAKLVDNSSTTFQNISTSTYPRYTSLVMGNSGTNRDLTPNLFRQMLAGLMQKSGNDRPSQGLSVLTNSWQGIEVEELYEGELRLTPDTKAGGMAIAAFNSALGRIDIEVDTDATFNKMYFVDFGEIYRAVQRPLSFRRQGGQIFLRSDLSGVHTATALEICELYIKERHTSGRLDDLNEDHATMY